MNEKSRENINRFLVEVDKYNFWNSIDIKIVSAKLEDKWTSLVTRILLIPEDETSSENLIDLQNFMILHEVLPIENLKEILNNLIDGKIKIGRDFELGVVGSVDFSEWDRRRESYAEQDWSAIALVAGGGIVTEIPIYEKINKELRNCDTPYEDLFVACKELLDIRNWNAIHLHVIAPIYVGLREVDFKENKILINVECHKSIEPRSIKLSSIIYTEEKPFRKKMEFKEEDIIQHNEYFCTYQKQIEIPNTSIARFYLFLNDKEMDWYVLTPAESLVKLNPGIVLHGSFDKDYEILKLWLEGKGNDPSRDFEASIHWLFHLCGFQCEWLGYAGKPLKSQSKGYGELDILAFVPKSQSIVVAECTIEPAKLQEKIAHIFNKTKNVEEILQNFEVASAVFIPINQEKIPKDIRDNAEKNKVALIEQEEIKRLLEMASTGATVNDVFNYINWLGREKTLKW